MGYSNNMVSLKDFINDQWASRAITNNLKINLTAEAGLLDSVFDLYSNLTGTVPDYFSLTDYPPELNYFLAETLHLLDDDISFDSAQISLLFDEDISNHQTLMNPVNLHFFYEKYKLG